MNHPFAFQQSATQLDTNPTDDNEVEQEKKAVKNAWYGDNEESRTEVVVRSRSNDLNFLNFFFLHKFHHMFLLLMVESWLNCSFICSQACRFVRSLNE